MKHIWLLVLNELQHKSTTIDYLVQALPRHADVKNDRPQISCMILLTFGSQNMKRPANMTDHTLTIPSLY